MKTRFLINSTVVLVAGIALSAACAQIAVADQPSSSPASSIGNSEPIAQPRLRYRIVVDQGKWDEIHTQQWNIPPDVADGIQAQLVDKLQKSGYFIVLEREAGAMDQQNQEDQIDATKRESIGAGASTMVARQQRTAANYIITPSVIGFTQTSGKSNGFSFGGLSIGGGKVEDTLTLNIRISDAQTSEMLDSQTAMGKADAKANGGGINLMGAGFTQDQFQSSPAGQAVDQALDDAVSKIVARLSTEPWTALVAIQDKTTGRVIINAGDLAGVVVGQIFDVYRAGAPVLDPDTGQTISTGDEVKIGAIKVARVQHSASYCDVIAGDHFLPRDIVQTRP